MATKLNKIKNGLLPELLLNFLLVNRVSYKSNPSTRTVYHRSESISFLGLKIWNIHSN